MKFKLGTGSLGLDPGMELILGVWGFTVARFGGRTQSLRQVIPMRYSTRATFRVRSALGTHRALTLTIDLRSNSVVIRPEAVPKLPAPKRPGVHQYEDFADVFQEEAKRVLARERAKAPRSDLVAGFRLLVQGIEVQTEARLQPTAPAAESQLPELATIQADQPTPPAAKSHLPKLATTQAKWKKLWYSKIKPNLGLDMTAIGRTAGLSRQLVSKIIRAALTENW